MTFVLHSVIRGRLGALIVCLLWMPAFALDAVSADNLATFILAQGGRTKGICELPRVGTGELALAFVHKSGMLVHAMNPDTASVRAARSMLDSTGLIGIRAYVEKGSAASIPLADNYADLVVITNVAAADLSSMPVAEIVRALVPGGKAFIGRAPSESAGASSSELQAWVNGRADAAVTSDANGTWAVITKARPAKIDNWTHGMHGPDNNPYSTDSVYAWPPLPQWLGKPYAGQNRFGQIVTSRGRMYQVQVTQNGRAIPLKAFRIHNGQLLWKREVGLQTGTHINYQSMTKGSMMVASGDELFIVNRNKVDRLDGETAALKGSFTCDSAAGAEVKWMAIDNGMLYTLTGSTTLDTVTDSEQYKKEWFGTSVSAFSIASGTRVWKLTEASRIDSREVGISTGRLFYICQGVKVVAVNSSTGAQIWVNNNAATNAALGGWGTQAGKNPTGDASGFICSATTLLNCQSEDSSLVALSATDGHVLWQTPRGGGRSQSKVVLPDGVVLNGDLTDATRRAWNLNTNQTAAQYANVKLGGGCGYMSASPEGIFGNSDGESYSFALAKALPSARFKTSCSFPMLVAEGFGINPNNTDCVCYRGNRALNVLTPAGAFAFGQQAVQSQRLELGPAAGGISTAVLADSLDWSTHRANIRHSGSVAVNLAQQHNLIWRYNRRHAYNAVLSVCSDTMDQENTPPVTAGTLVFWGGTDGYVRCFDGTARSQRWSFATGGRILATPTVANGCVYVGSMDGYAYCIEAGTGRLVWRFRAAPTERRINLYGSLASTWPVNSGVVVQNGVAYFAAGSAEGVGFGAYVYALNASTGTIVWQNTTSGSDQFANSRLQLNVGGYMTIVGNRLWVMAGSGRPGIFELADGRFDSLQGDLASSQGGLIPVWGREIGVLDNSHVIVGGRIQFADQGERGYGFYDRSKNPVDCIQLDGSGQPRYPQIHIGWNIARAPAWDNTSFYMATGPALNATGNPAKYNAAAMTGKVDAMRAAHPASGYVWWQSMAESADTAGLAQWTNTTVAGMNAIALANDGLVTLYSPQANSGNAQTTWTWYVAVLSPASGQVQWQTALPCAPTHEGLAIDRNGSILVSLANGDVYCYGAGTAVSVIARQDERTAAALIETSRNDVVQTDAVRRLNGSGSNVARASSERAPASPLAASEERGLKATFPLADSMAVMHDGSRALLQTIAPLDRGAAVYSGRDMSWHPDRPCLPVAAVAASSSASGNAPSNTIDRKMTSRWQPVAAGRQWLRYDLGSLRTVSSATVVWYSLKQANVGLVVETSVDGTSYQRADADMLDGRGTQTTLRTFAPVQARYVRVSVESTGTSAAPSVYEVGVHGIAGEEQASVR